MRCTLTPFQQRNLQIMDRLILGVDRALRTLTGQHTAARPSPARKRNEGPGPTGVANASDNPASDNPASDHPASEYPASRNSDKDVQPMTESQRQHAAGLMRVNHCGEICAQALYEGQALSAASPETRALLHKACEEEIDHLAWCEDRLTELDARPSLLSPLFYAGSWGLGVLTGLLGDRTSLGFVEATEQQVVAHLERHLEELPAADTGSRAVLEQMREDEARHGEQALAAGGGEFGRLPKTVMGIVARVMTFSTYRI